MKRKINKALELIAFFIYNRLAQLFLSLEENKVLIASEAQSELKGNLLSVFNELQDNYKDYLCDVILKSDRRDITSIKNKFKEWKSFTTSKYIFLDDFYGITSAIKLRKNQEIIQLWHACGAYKKFGYSRIDTGDKITSVNSGYKKYSTVVVSAEEIRTCYAEAFGVSVDKVVALGSPRTDAFFSAEKRMQAEQRVLQRYPELDGKKMVLFAPTYRGRKVQDAYYDFDKIDFELLTSAIGMGYQIVVKWHPALTNNIKKGLVSNYNIPSNIIDASEYPEINDLLIKAEILITDYSSIVFEWALMNKPIIYYLFDGEEYEYNRGLYFPFEEYIYGPVAKDTKELARMIDRTDLFLEKKQVFLRKFMGSVDGNSTKRIVKSIVGKE